MGKKRNKIGRRPRQNDKFQIGLLFRIIIAIQNVENMTVTVKESIIPTETMKHLHILKNRKVLKKNMPIL